MSGERNVPEESCCALRSHLPVVSSGSAGSQKYFSGVKAVVGEHVLARLCKREGRGGREGLANLNLQLWVGDYVRLFSP